MSGRVRLGGPLPTGKQITIIDESPTIAGETTEVFSVDSEDVLVLLNVDNISGTLDILVESLDGGGNSKPVKALPTISSPTSELVIVRVTEVTSLLRVTVTYSDAVEYQVGVRGADSEGVVSQTVDVPAGTPATLSSCRVDDCNGIQWRCHIYESSDATRKEYFVVTALHNGTADSDATAPVRTTTHEKLRTAKIVGLTAEPTLIGVGVEQTIGLQITATPAIRAFITREVIPL